MQGLRFRSLWSKDFTPCGGEPYIDLEAGSGTGQGEHWGITVASSNLSRNPSINSGRLMRLGLEV